MGQFISGAIMMGHFVTGLFFFRFWRKTRDRFFVLFASAFWILAFERIPLAFIDPANETRSLIYLIRLSAFLIILLAILDKNQSAKKTK